MATKERKELIDKLENKLKIKLLVLVTGDRPGLETRLAPDILPLVSEHLSQIGIVDELGLLIYTPGGDTIAGWGIVNLVRQYCNKLKVLVPFRALSCGTLIALGADEILMGKHGLLSPVDPSVNSPFNPPAPGPPQPGRVGLLPVSVEDMIGFLDLARKEIGLKSDEALTGVLNILAEKVHPMALGAVYRAREHNSSLARRLLLSHGTSEAKTSRIVTQLTQDLPTHSYLIGITEAREMQLEVGEIDDEVEKCMWALYKEYEDWFKFTRPYSPELDLGTEPEKLVRYERAVVESLQEEVLIQNIFITDKLLIKNKVMPGPGSNPVEQMMERIVYQGWVSSKDDKINEFQRDK